jgi:hypothetical protein
MGDVVDFRLCVLRLRSTSVAPRREARAERGQVALPRIAAQRSMQARISTTSCCGHTLKWRPRTWEAERSGCLHSGRST